MGKGYVDPFFKLMWSIKGQFRRTFDCLGPNPRVWPLFQNQMEHDQEQISEAQRIFRLNPAPSEGRGAIFDLGGGGPDPW